MIYSIYLTPAAIADISIAIDYYNSKSEGLGKRMANEVDQVLSKIAALPQAYSIRYRDIRAAKTPSFPFLIFYKIKGKGTSIEVLRVFNTYQKPFWKH